jgi:hypothetical protein
VFLFTGCNIFIQIPETTITARNDLVDLQVTVQGVTSDVDGVKLNNVTIGDIVFNSIRAGEETNPVATDVSGYVDIDIGSATATVAMVGLGGLIVRTDYTFEGIDPMETFVDEGEDNTVIFDEQTAGTIFSALAKKKAK